MGDLNVYLVTDADDTKKRVENLLFHESGDKVGTAMVTVVTMVTMVTMMVTAQYGELSLIV